MRRSGVQLLVCSSSRDVLGAGLETMTEAAQPAADEGRDRYDALCIEGAGRHAHDRRVGPLQARREASITAKIEAHAPRDLASRLEPGISLHQEVGESARESGYSKPPCGGVSVYMQVPLVHAERAGRRAGLGMGKTSTKKVPTQGLLPHDENELCTYDSIRVSCRRRAEWAGAWRSGARQAAMCSTSSQQTTMNILDNILPVLRVAQAAATGSPGLNGAITCVIALAEIVSTKGNKADLPELAKTLKQLTEVDTVECSSDLKERLDTLNKNLKPITPRLTSLKKKLKSKQFRKGKKYETETQSIKASIASHIQDFTIGGSNVHNRWKDLSKEWNYKETNKTLVKGMEDRARL
ncbi:hypothetical protein K438DRAFT_1746899 [Mycena galopus ATCC 62051]|nr:hypothetical protein K438DRAFT_1746899 [Mycena galopus ATCC 62051]